MLGRNILVLELLRLIERALDHRVGRRTQMLLRDACDLRKVLELRFDFSGQHLGAHAQACHQRKHNAVGLADQGSKQVHGLDLLLVVPGGELLRLLQGLLSFHCEFVKAHHGLLLSREPGRSKKGRQSPAPQVPSRTYLPAAATLTLTCFGLASSRFGMVNVSTPSRYSALMASVLTVFPSEKLRLNEP